MNTPEKRYAVRVTRDVAYGTAKVGVSTTTPKDRTLALDVYEPEGGPAGVARPALILAFGGAFHRGNKESDEFDNEGHRNTPMSGYCREFARRGYVAFSIDYRLVQEDPDPGTTPVIQDRLGIPRSRVDVVRKMLGLPPATSEMIWAGIEAACDDMVMAFRFVESNAARFGVDPARIALGGFSAGARTALNAAYGERVPAAAVICLSGFMADEDLGRHVVGGAGLPPAFIVTGENDLDYVARQFAPMTRHFGSVGVTHEAWQVPGGTHFYPATSTCVCSSGERSTLEEAMAAFVARSLGTPSA
ncbi:MAG: alpha/beta hydrolase [Burkholderiales bacterium]